jgi:3',5'-cyclic AMP phosphodiesterase CpdA
LPALIARILRSLPSLLLLAACLPASAVARRPAAPPAATPAGRHAAPITVYAAGDIARCANPDPAWSGAAATAALIDAGLAFDPGAAVLALGDLTYPVGAPAEFTDCYGPTWGRFKARTYPTPGNHEYATKGAAGYFGYFGAAAGPGYYSIRLGAWRVFSLNSNLAAPAHAVQLAWLRAELARQPARCTLAYWHHPLYSSGMKGNDDRMKDAWRVLYEAGADVVLSGHDHLYERFAPQDTDGRRDDRRGLRQFVVGTGGAFPTPFLRTRANSEARDSNHSGVLKLVLRDDGYDWQFLQVAGDSGEDEPDRGSARCH